MSGSTHWGLETDPNLELWDELIWVFGQLICQQRAHMEAGPADNHIVNPGADNWPCDWCFDASFDLMHTAGLLKLLQVYGAVAYASGRAGVPEQEAARCALQETVKQALQIEGATELLARVSGKNGWWELPLERDERRLSSDDEGIGSPSCD